MPRDIERVVGQALAGRRVLLAVSGGRDSMVLLESAARVARDSIAGVATFDHGSGAAATRAADAVAARACSLGLTIERARADSALHGEAAWRNARWRFLRDVAARHDALVATGHTRDDQIETVLLRAMRGAGARGLAALAAPGDVLRPLLGVWRAEVADYAARHDIAFVDDPSNASLAFARNRVRHEILPALLRARPRLGDELLEIADRAAALRRAVDDVIRDRVRILPGDPLRVVRADLLRYDAEGLRLLWPAIAAKARITLDRRGTERLAAFTKSGADGQRIQLSGFAEVLLHRGAFELRRLRASENCSEERALRPGLVVDGWRFDGATGESADAWSAPMPIGVVATVRGWRPGDRIVASGERMPRRVKGLLRDAGIAAIDRRGWPVVLAGGEIVWIPGVRRGSAATVRSGRPVAWIRCERIDGGADEFDRA